jgi:YgiT-type zinc finger domain-containing protein
MGNRIIVLPEHCRDARDVRSPSCHACGNPKMDPCITTGMFNVHGNSYIVTNINAWECPFCTEIVYSSQEAAMIERAIINYKEV